MRKWIFALPVLLLFFGGCTSEDEKPQYTEEELAQIPQPVRRGLPAPTGGFVLAVGDETISSADIIGPLLPRLAEFAQKTSFEEFSDQAMPVIAMTLRDQVADTLLYQQAKKQAGENVDEQLNAAVDKEMRKYIISFGGDYAKAEAFLKDFYGMNWEQFRTQQRRMILSGSYVHGKLADEAPVTYSDIKEYYDRVKGKLYNRPATITISLIDIDISKVEIKPDTPKQEFAAKKALEVMEKLKNGEDFAELAKQYSDGYRASSGGLWDAVSPDALAEPYDVLAVEAEGLAVSNIAGPLESGGHIFIMKLEDKQSATEIPLEEVQKEIEQKIIQERKIKNLDKVMSKVMEDAAISGIDTFAQYCIAEIYNRARQQ